MAASKTRIDWALLLLRLAVGGAAILHGFTVLRGAGGAITFAHAATKSRTKRSLASFWA